LTVNGDNGMCWAKIDVMQIIILHLFLESSTLHRFFSHSTAGLKSAFVNQHSLLVAN